MSLDASVPDFDRIPVGTVCSAMSGSYLPSRCGKKYVVERPAMPYGYRKAAVWRTGSQGRAGSGARIAVPLPLVRCESQPLSRFQSRQPGSLHPISEYEPRHLPGRNASVDRSNAKARGWARYKRNECGCFNRVKTHAKMPTTGIGLLLAVFQSASAGVCRRRAMCVGRGEAHRGQRAVALALTTRFGCQGRFYGCLLHAPTRWPGAQQSP
jgi:hypothetical protein